MFFKRQVVTCVFPYADMFTPLVATLVSILVAYAILITAMLIICRRNLAVLERVRVGLDISETRNTMNIRNIANERVMENNRVVRVMGSIVDVLKQ